MEKTDILSTKRKGLLGTHKKNSAFWTIVALIASGVVVVYVLKYFSDVETLLRSSGLLAPIISVLLYGLFSVTPVPTDSLTIINGAIFGPFYGTLIACTGNTFAALIEYFVGMKIGVAADTKGRSVKIPFTKKEFDVDSVAFLFLGRFIPGYGSKLVSVLAGMYRVNIIRYLWTTFAANITGALMFAYGGYGLRHLND